MSGPVALSDGGRCVGSVRRWVRRNFAIIRPRVRRKCLSLSFSLSSRLITVVARMILYSALPLYPPPDDARERASEGVPSTPPSMKDRRSEQASDPVFPSSYETFSLSDSVWSSINEAKKGGSTREEKERSSGMGWRARASAHQSIEKVLWPEVQPASVMRELIGLGHTNIFKILFNIYPTDEKLVGRTYILKYASRIPSIFGGNFS